MPTRFVTLAAAAVLCAAIPAMALDIPITVTEPAGVARQGEPVSGGIPLPAGQFKPGDGEQFALFDGDEPVPCQVIELAVDPAGDLRWLLLDFQVDLKPNEKRTFSLRGGQGALAPDEPLKVTDAADAVTIDTAAATLTVSKSRPFALIQSATADGKPVLDGGKVTYTDAFTGKTYAAAAPDSVVVEYAGPMRTTVCVKGGFAGDDANDLGWVARITAWSGWAKVHVKYSLANSNEKHYSYRLIQDSSIHLNLAARPEGVLLGANAAVEADGDAWINQTSRVVPAAIHGNDSMGTAPFLRRTPGASDGGAVAKSGDKVLWASSKGNQAAGWLAAKVGGNLVVADDLYFVEDPPRKLAVSGNTLVLSGVAEPLEGAQLPFAEKHRWLFDCSHLSSQYVIDLAAPAGGKTLADDAKRSRHRLRAMAEPDWYFQTAALPVGRFGSQSDEMACYKAWGWEFDPSKAPRKPAGQLANIQRYTAADDNHFTSEQDTVEALLLMHLRTGERSFFDAAESWVNYFMDLQTWRTDGWAWKDGGVWKLKQGGKGPLGNRPTRPADPVTKQRENIYGVWKNQAPFTAASRKDLFWIANAKACKCHNWGEGLVEWFMLTGDRDALEAAIDTVEQNYDSQVRAGGKQPGKATDYSRDFTRACFLTHATRLIAPDDKLVVEASDALAAAFLQRPNPEPRGLLNGPSSINMAEIRNLTTDAGVKAMQDAGIELDAKTGELVDPKTGARWKPIANPHTWMFPPLSRAMEVYYRITGNEDARDWLVAYGQAVGRVLYQPRHSNLSYGRMLIDFPRKGVALDWASWQLPADSTKGEGVPINSYLGTFYPDVPARGYELAGIELLKERAKDYWWGASHRGYNATKMHSLGKVGTWANAVSTHGETVCYTGKTFWIWAHPRADTSAPAAVDDLAVTRSGDKVTVTFTAPAEQGGRIAEVQLKAADRPIVDYETFLKRFADDTDKDVVNWFLAANLSGEPRSAKPGEKVTFTVAVPEGLTHFALVTFDDSSNRSAISNVAEAK